MALEDFQVLRKPDPCANPGTLKPRTHPQPASDLHLRRKGQVSEGHGVGEGDGDKEAIGVRLGVRVGDGFGPALLPISALLAAWFEVFLSCPDLCSARQ